MGTTPQNSAETLRKKAKKIKVLTIGHSLAVNATQMLARIAALEGYPEMEVGTLYYSGCPLARHVKYLQEDANEYWLFTSNTEDVSNPPQKIKNVTMKYGIQYTDWDIIILQGGVFEIGKDETYTDGNIQTIQNYVNENKLNPNAVFGWHMPWPGATDINLVSTYSKADSWTSKYAPYDNDRTKLYNAITKCVSKHILPDDSFQYFIPSGTAFENAMSSYLEEKDLHRDYAHATDYARLLTAYLWYCVLAGVEQLEDIKMTAIPKEYFAVKTVPEELLAIKTDIEDYVVLTETEKAIIIEAVNNALKNPLQVTQSQYTQAPVK